MSTILDANDVENLTGLTFSNEIKRSLTSQLTKNPINQVGEVNLRNQGGYIDITIDDLEGGTSIARPCVLIEINPQGHVDVKYFTRTIYS